MPTAPFRFALTLAGGLSALAPAAFAAPTAPAETPLHAVLELALSPDGRQLASVEGQDPPGGFEPPVQHLLLRRPDAVAPPVAVALPCGDSPQCWPSSLVWRRDGQKLAFVLRQPGTHDDDLYEVGPDGHGLTKLLTFGGTLGALRFGPDDHLAVLATANADKEVGATEAGAPIVGTLGGPAPEQRIAVLDQGVLRWASPPDLFVYQYDWRPDGRGFVGTAAHGDGDNNWWFARLWAFRRDDGAATELFHPGPREQLADPVVSPDGRSVEFIGGLMSDFIATGGDVFSFPLAATAGAAQPTDLTPGLHASATALGWNCHDGTLEAELLRDADTVLVDLGRTPRPGQSRDLWSGPRSIGANNTDALSIACGTGATATVTQDWTTAPEIAAGSIGAWRPITRDNAGQTMPALARSITWRTDGFREQGWLLLPTGPDGTVRPGRRPMVTEVHGGPAAANTPAFAGPGLERDLLARGVALFEPNPRGSFGQGERFTSANVRDLGHGDLRDILAGIDAAAAAAPIDPKRLGITGGSYGGFMTMWAVTQTDRFRAGVAFAGVSDWLSYYGENGIDGWMTPYFGASVYADPAVYARSSPINFITRVRTPTAAFAGQYDIECPPEQTQEFWHALHDLGVPTETVIYPGEGHGFRDARNVADARRRALAWFDRYLGTTAASNVGG